MFLAALADVLARLAQVVHWCDPNGGRLYVTRPTACLRERAEYG